MWTTLRRFISPVMLYSLFRGRHELVKIRVAQVYVGGVKKVRVFYLGCLFILSALVLLFSGLFLLHTSLLNFSPWDTGTKFAVGLSLGIIELGAASAIMVYLFKEETWSRLFGVADVVDCIMKDKQKSRTRTDGAASNRGNGNGKLHH